MDIQNMAVNPEGAGAEVENLRMRERTNANMLMNEKGMFRSLRMTSVAHLIEQENNMVHSAESHRNFD